MVSLTLKVMLNVGKNDSKFRDEVNFIIIGYAKNHNLIQYLYPLTRKKHGMESDIKLMTTTQSVLFYFKVLRFSWPVWNWTNFLRGELAQRIYLRTQRI